MTTALREVPAVAGTDDPDPELDRISREDAADRLGVSLATLARYAAAGLLKSRRRNPITNRTTYSAAEVDKLRRQREQ